MLQSSDTRSLFDNVGEDYAEVLMKESPAKPLHDAKHAARKKDLGTVKFLCEYDNGFELLLERVKLNCISAKEIATFLKKRAVLEENYAKALYKLATSSHEKLHDKSNSFSTSMHSFYKLHESIANSKLDFSQHVHELSSEFSTLSKNTERGRKELKESGMKHLKIVHDSEEALEKTIIKYESTSEEWEKSVLLKENGLQPTLKRGLTRSFSNVNTLWKQPSPLSASTKINKQEEESRNRAAVANETYKNQLIKTNLIRQQFFNNHLPELITSLKDVNDECDQKLKQFLCSYGKQVENSIMKEATSVCPIEKDGQKHGMQDILANIDAEKDMDSFIWEYIGNHGAKPKHAKGNIQYSPYSGLASTNNLANASPALADPPSFGVSLDEITTRDGCLVPNIVIKLIEAIESPKMGEIQTSVNQLGIRTQGLYRQSGSHQSIQQLRNIMDKDLSRVDIQNLTQDVHVLAGLLKLYFRELPGSLLSKAVSQEFIEATKCSDEEEMLVKTHEVINKLPDPNYATLKAIMQHLWRVQHYESENKMSIKNLGIVWGPTLMDASSTKVTPSSIAEHFRHQSRVVEIIIGNFEHIFEV